jgi:CubicO group peptidase (beta-lactamase class C family)
MEKITLIIFSVLALFQHQIWLTERGTSEGFDLDSEIRKEISDHKIPSMVACIIKDKEIVWKKAYGYADIDNNIQAASDTIYSLASVSKLVVVTAVMQLAELGFIDIDEDVDSYLPFHVRNPNYPDQKITVRMLLTHTSGIAGPGTDEELPGFYDWYPADSAPALGETMMDYLLPGGLHYVPAVWKKIEAGKQELYSNLGVTLLAYLVEFVSGEEFNSYCRNHVFLPLEMLNTSYSLNDLDADKIATWYIDSYAAIPHYSRRDYPAGQLKSSVDEFSHFLIAYMNGGEYNGRRILNKSTIDEILKIHNPASGVCLIWMCMIDNWYGHSGGVNGASSYVEFNRQDNVGLIIFANIFLGKGSTLHPPRGKIYSLIRKEANRFRSPNESDRESFSKNLQNRFLRLANTKQKF